MNKIFLSMLLLPFMAAAQKSYTVTGRIANLKEPAIAVLTTLQDNKWKDKDSVAVKNGQFKFQGSLQEPEPVIISVSLKKTAQTKSPRDYISFFLENSSIQITAADSIKNGLVTGSAAETENRSLEAKIKPLTNTIISLNDQFRGKPKDEAWKKASDSVTHLVAEIKNIKYQFVASHLNAFIGLYIFNRDILDSKFEPAKVEPLFIQFSTALKSSALGQRSLEKIEIAKRRQSGAKATDFTQTDLNDQPFTLSSLRGKYVLVDFWASWCVPCRAENPNLVKAYNELKGKNFEVVGVSLDQGKPAWAAAVKKDNLPWIHVSDLKGWKNEVAAMYGISAVPQNLLINPDGIIIAKNLRGEDLTEKLKQLIK